MELIIYRNNSSRLLLTPREVDRGKRRSQLPSYGCRKVKHLPLQRGKRHEEEFSPDMNRSLGAFLGKHHAHKLP